eukprot:5671016-Pyramimonas_sp.AAC.1
MLARTIWTSWVPRDLVARLMFASEAAILADPSKSDWPLVEGPISAAVASCRWIGWRLGPGACMLLTHEGGKIDLTRLCPRSVLHVVRFAFEDWLIDRAHRGCEYLPSLSHRQYLFPIRRLCNGARGPD